MAVRIPITPDRLPQEINTRHILTRRAVANGIGRAAERGRALIVRKTPVDMGQLKASWRVVWHGVPGGAQWECATLENDAPHAGIVEEGARPHPVNAEGWDAIYQWARRHITYTQLKGPGRAKGGKRREGPPKQITKRHGQEDPILEGIVWAIVKRIEKYGQAPTYFVRNNIPALQKIATEEISKALARMNERSEGGLQ